MAATLRFCASGKKGLGHLRRITNIAHALRKVRPDLPLALIVNAPPAGMTTDEERLYAHIEIVEREYMACCLRAMSQGPVIVDTAVIPRLATIEDPLCLILRETIAGKLRNFRLDGDRPWDLLLLPNPEAEWQPETGSLPAKRTEPVGWIYRQLRGDPSRQWLPRRNGDRQVLVASGGGGSGDVWIEFRQTVGELVQNLRNKARVPITVTQVLGPRAGNDARIDGVDRFITPGAFLPQVFAEADAVLSTAGYNSVLELAAIDVPTLLIPVPRTYDDQLQRARRWGERLGLCHERGKLGRSSAWTRSVVEEPRRRCPIDIGPSGASAAAQFVEQLAA